MPPQDTFKTYRAVSHSIKAPNEWPVANFVVYLNRQGWANRAELHLNADALEQNGSESRAIEEWEEFALAAANKIVDENYTAYRADYTKLEVRLLHVEQRRPTEHFDMDYVEGGRKQSIFGPRLLAAIGAALLILMGAIWGFSTFS